MRNGCHKHRSHSYMVERCNDGRELREDVKNQEKNKRKINMLAGEDNIQFC